MKHSRSGSMPALHTAAALLAVALLALAPASADPLRIDRVEAMPAMPEPYILRDWRQVALDLDALLFDLDREGRYLPVAWWVDDPNHEGRVTFGLPAYIGWPLRDFPPETFDTITCLGAVLGATLVGVDKTDHYGHDWVRMCEAYFSSANGQNLYLNNLAGATGNTFWYELLPGILATRIMARYPGHGEMESHLRITAERWYEACRAMGASEDPWCIPDFDHTAFDFSTMEPVDNGVWREPDAAAAVAWQEYMAWVHTEDPRFLSAAKWAMGFLEQRGENPFYESLMPYGAYTAARMNAEVGTAYDVHRYVNWVFDADNPREWGVLAKSETDPPMDGMLAHVPTGYAFAMNTFDAASQIALMVRYDDRYARSAGRWLLNVFNNMRLFYPNAHPPERQTDLDWARANDPAYCVAYEGVREEGLLRDRATGEIGPAAGRLVEGDWRATIYGGHGGHHAAGEVEILEAAPDLRHTWKVDVTPGRVHHVVIYGHAEGAGSFQFAWSTEPDGERNGIFRIASSEATYYWWALPAGLPAVHIHVTGAAEGGADAPARLVVDDLYVETYTGTGPFAMGDPRMLGWGRTNLGLYGSVFVGAFGAMVQPTDVEGIVRVDCLATDTWPPPAYPTALYYNPYPEARTIRVDCAAPCDLYDAVGNHFVARDVEGAAAVEIPADSAVMLVECPAGGTPAYDGPHTTLEGVTIDYNNGREPLPQPDARPTAVDRSRQVSTPHAAIEVDGDAADWDGLDAQPIAIDTAPNGDLRARLRFAWDDSALYTLIEEQPGDQTRVEPETAGLYIPGPFSFDGAALFFDLDNSNDRSPQGDFNAWFGFSSRRQSDLLTARPAHTQILSADCVTRSRMATSGSIAEGNRVIEAAVAWADLAESVRVRNQPAGGLPAAVRPGYRFGCEPLLLDDGWQAQSFIGGSLMPGGRDEHSIDLVLAAPTD